MIDIQYTASPLELVGASIALIALFMFFLLLVLALNDQRIVVGLSSDHTNRIIASNAVINEFFRLLIGFAILVVWIAAIVSPPSRLSDGVSPTTIVTFVMFVTIQLTTLIWGLKDIWIRRRLIGNSQDGGQPHENISIPPDFPPGNS